MQQTFRRLRCQNLVRREHFPSRQCTADESSRYEREVAISARGQGGMYVSRWRRVKAGRKRKGKKKVRCKAKNDSFVFPSPSFMLIKKRLSCILETLKVIREQVFLAAVICIVLVLLVDSVVFLPRAYRSSQEADYSQRRGGFAREKRPLPKRAKGDHQTSRGARPCSNMAAFFGCKSSQWPE